MIAGTFTARAPASGPAPISVDEGLATDMRLHLGDTIDWDLQGVVVHSVVGSIRTVDWRRLAPNFFVVFPLGVLEDAPKFYVAAVRTSGPEASGNLQRAVVQAFPNVTAIDLGVILETLDGIFRKISFVIEFMAGFTGATALVVLASAVVAGGQQRRREAVLLRTLGASRRQLAWIQAAEYAVLGTLAATIGTLLGWLASALLAHFFFHLQPASPPSAFFLTITAVTAITLLTGWLADRGMGRSSPLEVLRSEG